MTGSPPTSPRSLARRTTAAALLGALATLAATLALVCAPAAGAATTTTMVMEGRGWGHGIGMSQYGADGYALHHWKYAAIIEHYYTGVTLGKVGNVSVRVLLRSGTASATVTDAAKFNAVWGAKTVHLAAGATATVTWSGGAYHLRAGARSWSAGVPITFVPTTARLRLLTANDNGHVGHYRGRLRIVHLSDGLEIVNTLSLETYLYGVVPCESPASWPVEALKAQAVAARSYAYRLTGRGGSFDVYCTTASQILRRCRQRDGRHRQGRELRPRGSCPSTRARPSWPTSSRRRAATPRTSRTCGPAPPRCPTSRACPTPTTRPRPTTPGPTTPSAARRRQIAAALGFAKGPLRAVYVVKRGTSPRVVKALLIGDKGWATTNGASLRADLGLRDAWVYFTSLSIARSATTVTYGTAATLTGRRYPALAAGQAATLHLRPTGGAWSTRAVTATAGSSTVDGYTVKSTRLSAKVAPDRRRPSTTSRRRAAMGATRSPPTSPSTSGRPSPSRRRASTVAAGDGGRLHRQRHAGARPPRPSGCRPSTERAGLDQRRERHPRQPDGSYSVSWTPPAPARPTLRVLALPASTQLVAGREPAGHASPSSSS